ncbi:hypothetical protein N7509_012640 [Penicillium cosmopolitanum]|uniref:Uncharacterized protein n=1 Tax=Penicillium cosmopolitanum TaxID=1131564 RepID=A0A9W9SJ27_9EURO|nr:uncharacterized protein N7509_012640 [Penicillium cosmopolitanum]KAJ5379521.1 hypothetical protein N7509_012640 [Penicillium cosmopolitanum]
MMIPASVFGSADDAPGPVAFHILKLQYKTALENENYKTPLIELLHHIPQVQGPKLHIKNQWTGAKLDHQ